MNWRRLGGGLAISLMIGLLAGGFVFAQFKKLAQAKSIPTIPVVVTARAIPLGTRLQASDLRVLNWPAAQPVQGAFSKISDCVSRAAITSMVENEPLLAGKLGPKDGGAGLSATIPSGMRAVSVSVNDVIGVAGFVVPGTMVDVLVTGSMGSSGNVTRTILENVRVLAVGQKVEAEPEVKPQTAPVITLLVSPEDANKLTLASTQGRIQLALRNALDSVKADPAPVLQATLFGGATPPAPAAPVTAKKASTHVPEKPKAAPEGFNVEVIRGSKKEEATFPATTP